MILKLKSSGEQDGVPPFSLYSSPLMHRSASEALAKKQLFTMMQPEPIGVLQGFARSLREDTRVIQLWILDPRDNAVPIDSYGHIHHSLTLIRPAVKWLRVVEKLVESQTFGLRETLSVSVEAFQYRSLRYLT